MNHNDRLCTGCRLPFYSGPARNLTCPDCDGKLAPQEPREVTDHMDRPRGERLDELGPFGSGR